MKKVVLKRILIIAVVLAALLGVLCVFSTGVPVGKAVLNYKGTHIDLNTAESFQMWCIFAFNLYNPGIGGCPYQEDVSISFGDTVYAIACDDCYSAKNWNAGKYIEFNRLEFAQIIALFEKYCGDTEID